MNKEDFFIHALASGGMNRRFIGDDGVEVEGMVYSKDAFFENVHFRREWFSLKEIAAKAMLVNISDAIVMNAIPKYVLLGVAIPRSFTRQNMRELASGFLEVAQQYGISIIGGDTISNTKLDITITLVSEPKQHKLPRTGVKQGDLLAYTGELGSVLADFRRLKRTGKIHPDSRFRRPVLRDAFFYEAAPLMNAAMDISDGLFFELERLSKASRVGFWDVLPDSTPYRVQWRRV